MERSRFFSTLGISAGMIFLAPVLNSCSKSMDDGTNPPGGGNNGDVDFTLDLSSSTYSALNTNGGFIIKDRIIVARTSTGIFVALSSVCTHEGATIGYDGSANRFHCPNHGSNFTTEGAVINGPASSALKKYNTQLTGTSLRV
ncbi:MAG TPA: Rieske 2Fe-2S domain-containing protein, partial [Prolixibacteraceae bacterium]|nr:Rieske 2Fe-2S domain-containing protein [Prolixibacteraceae bacterium]